MKNLWLHGIYLSIIGVLCFQLWSTTAATRLAFEQVETAFKKDYEALNSNSTALFNSIYKNCMENQSSYNVDNFAKVQDLKKNSTLNINYIERQISNIEQSKVFKFEQLKDTLLVFSEILNSFNNGKFSNDTLLRKKYGLKPLIENNSFYKAFESNPKAFLRSIANQIKMDEIEYLYYVYQRTTHQDLICGPIVRLAIAPKKAVLINGEKFEADLYLSSYSNNPKLVTFIVDNQNLSIKDGVAHFSKTDRTVGLKKISAQAIVHNAITGENMTVKSEYEYHVLPKCSKNCQ